MNVQLDKTKHEKQKVDSDAIFLKRLRQNLGLNRTEACKLLGFSISTIKRYETNKIPLTNSKIEQFLTGYCVSHREFLDFKMGKETQFLKPNIPQKPKILENNLLRRSYKKKITTEVKAIIRLRKIKGISQYEASSLCGWHKTAIGHIEQGRIELSEKKIKHIVMSFGSTLKKFKEHANSNIEREMIEQECVKTIRKLEDSKLLSLQTILKNF